MSCNRTDHLPRKPLRHVTALLLSLLLSGGAAALPEDRDQPIHITADQALRDEKKGMTIYSGNVHMNQGSMQIDADKITIYHTTEDVERVIAVGNPARMQQQPDPEKGPVFARAHVITYYRDEERVHLEQEAHIERDGATVTGDSIDYFIAEELVKADSDQAQAGSRVQVVIPPQLTQEVGKERGTADGE